MHELRAAQSSNWVRTILGVRAGGLVLIGLTIPTLVDGFALPFVTTFGRLMLDSPGQALALLFMYYGTSAAVFCVGAYFLFRDAGSLLRRTALGGKP